MKKPFKIGDFVTTKYHGDEEKHIIRKITMCEKNVSTGSGWMASADDGGVCTHCGNRRGTAVNQVDAAWFEMVKK